MALFDWRWGVSCLSKWAMLLAVVLILLSNCAHLCQILGPETARVLTSSVNDLLGLSCFLDNLEHHTHDQPFLLPHLCTPFTRVKKCGKTAFILNVGLQHGRGWGIVFHLRPGWSEKLVIKNGSGSLYIGEQKNKELEQSGRGK